MHVLSYRTEHAFEQRHAFSPTSTNSTNSAPDAAPLGVACLAKKKSTSCQTQVGIGHSDPAHMGGIYTLQHSLQQVPHSQLAAVVCMPSTIHMFPLAHVFPAYALQDTCTQHMLSRTQQQGLQG